MSERIPAIGTLRDRVQIQRKDMSAETEGGHMAVFVPIATVWARVRALSGASTYARDGQAVRGSHVVVMRYRTDVSAGDRVIYRGQALDIVAAEDLNGRRAYLSCQCTHKLQVG